MKSSRSPSSASSPSTLEVTSESVDMTRRLGTLLGGLLVPGDVVLLVGDLGAGKTALTQGIGRGLGVTATINSPTFTILKEYSGRIPLYHFDLYRVDDPRELEALGFEEYFTGDGVSVIEWAERGERPDLPEGALWPRDALRIELTVRGDRGRVLDVTAAGSRSRELLDGFARAATAEVA